MRAPADPNRLLPIAKPDQLGLGVGRRAIGQRMRDDPDFPPVYKIGGRNYVQARDCDAYREKLMARALQDAGVGVMAADRAPPKGGRGG